MTIIFSWFIGYLYF